MDHSQTRNCGGVEVEVEECLYYAVQYVIMYRSICALRY